MIGLYQKNVNLSVAANTELAPQRKVNSMQVNMSPSEVIGANC